MKRNKVIIRKNGEEQKSYFMDIIFTYGSALFYPSVRGYYLICSPCTLKSTLKEDVDLDNLSIKDVEVQYPSTTRKRININIKFNDNSDVTGSIQLAIRSKSGESNQNFGFIACQCVWGNVKINIKD